MKRLILIILASVTLMACARQRPQEAYDALASLRKIQAATEVGVLYPQYNELLIDAQAGVNNAENVLPDGPVKTELRLTMDSYIDAGVVWQERLRNGDEYYLTSDLEPGKSLMRSTRSLLSRCRIVWQRTPTKHYRLFGLTPTRD